MQPTVALIGASMGHHWDVLAIGQVVGHGLFIARSINSTAWLSWRQQRAKQKLCETKGERASNKQKRLFIYEVYIYNSLLTKERKKEEKKMHHKQINHIRNMKNHVTKI